MRTRQVKAPHEAENQGFLAFEEEPQPDRLILVALTAQVLKLSDLGSAGFVPPNSLRSISPRLWDECKKVCLALGPKKPKMIPSRGLTLGE
jgi:hypothetical protein